MGYRAEVKVVMLSLDETTEKMLAVPRTDISFTLLVHGSDTIVNMAKEHFAAEYGPDLVVRACNLQDRTKCLLYCMHAGAQQKTGRIRDIVTQMLAGRVVERTPR